MDERVTISRMYHIVINESQKTVSFKKLFEENQFIKELYCVKHIAPKPHYHIFVDFGVRSVVSTRIANIFKIRICQVEPVYYCDDKRHSLLYMMHTEDCSMKTLKIFERK